MARAHFRRTYLDPSSGDVRPLANATVKLYSPDSTTLISGVWSARTGGTALNASQFIQTNGAGVAEAWLDLAQTADVVVTNSSGATMVTETIGIYPSPEDLSSAVPTSAKGLVCIGFDDCYYEQKAVTDHMFSLGQHPTMFVNKAELGGVFGYSYGHPNNLDLTDLLTIQQQGGEIANHTQNHLDMTALTAAQRASSLDTVNSELVAAGITLPTSFAYPYGYENIYTNRDVASRFRIFRYPGILEVPRYDAGSVFRVGAIRLFSDSADPSGFGQGAAAIKDAKALARLAVARPVIISFFCHLGPNYQYPAGVEPTVSGMISFLDYLDSIGVPVVTYREAFGQLNSLANPGFEDHGSVPVGWSIFYNFGSGASSIVAATPLTGLFGTQALKLNAPTASDGAQRGQRVAVVPGKSYMLSGRVQLQGGPAAPTTFAADNFGRTVTDDWGTADTGGAWTRGTGNAAAFDVASGKGTIVSSSGDVNHYATLAVAQADVDGKFSFQYDISPVTSGVNFDAHFVFRFTNISNYMYVTFRHASDGLGAIQLWKVVSNAHTQIGSQVVKTPGINIPGAAAATKFWGRVQAVNTTIRAKFWADADEQQPDAWQMVITDAMMPINSGGSGLGVLTGTPPNPVTFSFDDLLVQTAQGVQADYANPKGLRLTVFQMNANGDSLGSTETRYINLQSTSWTQLALDTPLTMGDQTVACEIRASLNGVAGYAWVHNVVFGLYSSQPEGPLG